MSSAPSRIYLQVGEDAESLDHYSESTWCSDRINDSDVEYVRGDLVSVPHETPPGLQESLKFVDAVRLARGSLDYGGGYWSTEERAIFHHGIKTVINVLENAAERGLSDSQTRAVYAMGALASPVKVEPTHQGTASLSYPTADDTSDPVFVAIWQTIRGWNLERTRGAELAWANGMDAFAILQAVRASLSGAQRGEAGKALYEASCRAIGVPEKEADWFDLKQETRDRFRHEANVLAHPAPGGEDRRDAERYRWLADNMDGNAQCDFIDLLSGNVLSRKHFDAAIDAAMSPPPTSGTSRPFTPEEHAAWERENGVGEAAKGEGERG